MSGGQITTKLGQIQGFITGEEAFTLADISMRALQGDGLRQINRQGLRVMDTKLKQQNPTAIFATRATGLLAQPAVMEL
jgi:hypothetical protein